MKYLKIILDKILKLFDFLTIIMTMLIVIILSTNVVLRYGFGRSLGPWTRELSTIFLIWITFLVSCELLRDEDHFQVPMIIDHKINSTKVRFFINTLTRGLMILFFLMVIRFSVVLFNIRSLALTMRWLPMRYIYIIVPFTFFVSLIIEIINIYDEYINVFKEEVK